VTFVEQAIENLLRVAMHGVLDFTGSAIVQMPIKPARDITGNDEGHPPCLRAL
jgi:hypothetical protein